MEVYLLRVASW